MDYPFTRYLKAKMTVDDRAINRSLRQQLINQLVNRFNKKTIHILDLGAGAGSMLQRLMDWDVISHGQYLGIDSNSELHSVAISEISGWGERSGFNVETKDGMLSLAKDRRLIQIDFQTADINEFLDNHRSAKWDLIIANAFLDLVDLFKILSKLNTIISPDGLAYFTINYDGTTRFDPVIDPLLDSLIIKLYDQTMDDRPDAGKNSGGSHTGRKIFKALDQTGWEIIASGESNWEVHPAGGYYAGDEQYFLLHILQFVESSLVNHPELNPEDFSRWIRIRSDQILDGKLTFTAHNLDFLAAKR